MGYYMRYITTSPSTPTLDAIREALVPMDERYRLDTTSTSPPVADVYFDDVSHGELKIVAAGSPTFAEEVTGLKEGLSGAFGDDPEPVRAVLERATAIIALSVAWSDCDHELTLERLDPLWEWFMENHEGLIQADNEGYYDDSGLILGLD